MREDQPTVEVTLPGAMPNVINESIDISAGAPDSTTYMIWGAVALVVMLIISRR